MVLWENEPNGAKIIDRTLNLESEKIIQGSHTKRESSAWLTYFYLLVYIQKILFKKQAILIRRSTVLSFSLRQGFPDRTNPFCIMSPKVDKANTVLFLLRGVQPMVLWENEPNGAKINSRTLNLVSEKVIQGSHTKGESSVWSTSFYQQVYNINFIYRKYFLQNKLS